MPHQRLSYWWYVISPLDFPPSLYAIKRSLDLDQWMYGNSVTVIFCKLNSTLNFNYMKMKIAKQYFNSNHLFIATGLSCPLCIPNSSYSFRMRPSRIVVVDKTFVIRTYLCQYFCTDVRKWLNNTTFQPNNMKSTSPLQIIFKLKQTDDGDRWYPIDLTY